ncbi:hypothetical protein [Demequina iriomotensis]|uniref:hypothetical protein n=1 Tax=Demequina iriomotensis TaxID=1536641 RepID=UPI000784F377|nr:hypothetical protein [Demequina iriomotensis]
MANPRLEFALTQLQSEHWRSFERLCSEFLVTEFPDLRTTASASGDKGRDGELFEVGGDPTTAFQYSVAGDWKAKISDTLAKVTKNLPKVRRLVFCSSQEIGAQGDVARDAAWKLGIQLDVRDRNWFVERSGTSPERATASEELAGQIADPVLQERRVIERVASPLTPEEGRVAILQLAMNAQDRTTERGLTKSSFDSLVTAALVDTTSENAKSRDEVRSVVRGILPGGAGHQIDALVDSALKRLARKHGPIKHRTQTDSFHMSFEESQEWRARAAEYLLDQDEVEADLAAGAYGLDQRLDADISELRTEARKLRQVLEGLFMRRGEMFARSVQGAEQVDASLGELADMIAQLDHGLVLPPAQAAQAISNVLEAPSDRTRAHLLRIVDSYTLFAFLQQTPDVQKTLSRVFAGGEIWLDTSAVLPLLGETLVADVGRRGLTNLLAAARGSGIRLFVTGGVLEEVVAHLDISLLYPRRTDPWRGRIPFIYTAYMMSGRAEEALGGWVEEFKGSEEPVRDVEDYLEHYFGILRQDLSELADGADVRLRGAVQELWGERHRQRRERHGQDSANTHRLIAHDVENVVGVIEHRRSHSDSALGYTAWWLTLDGTAFALQAWLKDRLGKDAPASPVLSPDYLSQVLRLGPLRRRQLGDGSEVLPLTLSLRVLENVPDELIDVARSAREEFKDFDELRIRREVRDALNRARRSGSGERDYAASLEAEILQAIAE